MVPLPAAPVDRQVEASVGTTRGTWGIGTALNAGCTGYTPGGG